MDIVTQNQQTVECKVVTEDGQTLEGTSDHSGTELRDGTVQGTDRQWTDCKGSSGQSNTEATDGTA